MNKKFAFFSFFVILSMLFSACALPRTESRTAAITNLANDVRARASTNVAFAPASLGQQLTLGGEVQSGGTGKARLAIQPDNTFVYVGPNTLFSLAEFKLAEDGTPSSKLKLERGQLWIVLGGGSLVVETAGGMASVRGSFMGVGFTPKDGLNLTCLEGHCSFTNDNGTTELTGGQACDVTPDDPACQTRDMNEDENQAWQDNVPESNDVVPTETPSPLPPTPTFTPSPTFTPTPQSVSESGEYGPQIEDFPPGINPLTGLPVTDLSLLDLPAIMISISHFPALDARPQAGLSYAPWIFEIYMGYGETRFLATFYGEEPAVEPRPGGSCDVRTEPFVVTGVVLGNRAWIDENANGIQDPNELGVGGICVTLYDPAGNVLQTTSTDSNGYYGFNVEAGQTYSVGFEKPNGLDYTTPDVGFDDLDSDADPTTGRTPPITVSGTDMNWDAGYVPVENTGEPTETVGPGTPTPTVVIGSEGLAGLPPPEVGPIRSMRLPYGRISKFFQGGCIISASGYAAVLAQVPGCKYVFGDDSSVSHALLNITEMRALAEDNKKSYQINYSGNIFNPNPPAGGKSASEVDVFWNWTDQSQFRYDPLSGAYQRFANRPGEESVFTSQTDRLTGRQLLYQNVIIMYVDYVGSAETMQDINLVNGMMGRADLFRNGQLYHIYWDTIGQDYEQETQRLRPIRFTDSKGNPFPLAPGHTWVHMFTNASGINEKVSGSGIWKATFIAPAVP